jgi:hypothetical protein
MIASCFLLSQSAIGRDAAASGAAGNARLAHDPGKWNRFPTCAKPCELPVSSFSASAGEGRSEKIMRKQNLINVWRFNLNRTCSKRRCAGPFQRKKEEREVASRHADCETAALSSLWPFHLSCDISLSSQLRKATISRRVSRPGGMTSQ